MLFTSECLFGFETVWGSGFFVVLAFDVFHFHFQIPNFRFLLLLPSFAKIYSQNECFLQQAIVISASGKSDRLPKADLEQYK